MILVVALMMEAVSTSGRSINFHETEQRNIPEACRLHNEDIHKFFSLCHYSPRWAFSSSVLRFLNHIDAR
jgi:hypothetical protein